MTQRRGTLAPFLIVLSLLVIGVIGWSVTGRPFPGQTVAVRNSDLADYRSVIATFGLTPDDPRVVDTRAWVPMSAEWGGIASTFITDNGQYRIAVWVGQGTEPGYEPETSFGLASSWQIVRTGYAEGIAQTWEIAGNRHGGVAVWSPQLLEADVEVADEILTKLRAVDP